MIDFMKLIPKLLAVLERIANSIERIEKKMFPEEGQL